MKRIYSLVIAFLTLAPGYCQQKDFVITAFGAQSGGVFNNVSVIQDAIDSAFNSGGGRVVIPQGRFMTGVIHLKSNVELFVEEGGVLLASARRSDYGPSQKASGWIMADHAKNISIKGKGILDGQGDLLVKDIYRELNSGRLYDKEWKQFNDWHQRRPGESNRPRMIECRNCDGVTVKNIHIQNGTSWIQDYRNCSHLAIDSIQVFSNTFLNNDGIDMVDCKNAIITNCNINVADDGICLKSQDRNRRCENIYVANCKVRSSASAIKLGTASRGGFKNIVIKNIEVYDTYRSAIAIESVDGGVLQDVVVQHIHAIHTGNAFFIRLGHRNKDSVISQLRNVFIHDVTVEVPGTKPDKGYPMEGPELRVPSKKEDTTIQYPNGAPWGYFSIDTSAALIPHNIFPSSVTGIPGHPVENVVLQNITIVYEGGGAKSLAFFPLDSFKMIPEAVTDYPEFSMFGELPVWGVYARHVKGITFKNIKLINKKEDYRSAVLVDDAAEVTFQKFAVAGATAQPVLFFNDAKALKLEKMEIPGNRKETIRINNAVH